MSLRAGGDNRREQMRARNERNAFKRAKEMFAQIAAAADDVSKLAAIGKYKSRGKGRGTPSRRYGHPDGRYRPHQGMQERARRRVRGWAGTGMTKHEYLYRTLEI